MPFVLGKDKILSIRENATEPWRPIGCLTSNSVNETIEILPTTTRDNKGWSTGVASNQAYTIPFAGVQQVDEVGTLNFQGFESVKTLKRTGTLIQWKVEDIANGVIEIGDGYFTELSDTADVQGFATFEGVITGYGPPIDFTDTQKPTAPVLSLTGQDSEKITIEWTEATDNVGVVQYIIYRNDVVYDNVSYTIRTYEDYAILDGQIYTYNVQAVDSSTNASWLSNKVISSLVSRPGDQYLTLESSADPSNVLLLESSGAPLILESA